MLIQGKNVLLTGASSGLGKALAEALAAKGAVLGLLARNRDRLEATARQIQDENPTRPAPILLPGDITDSHSITAAINQFQRSAGPLDVLINNAGSGVYGAAQNTSMQDFRDQLEVNFLSAVNFTLQALPQMRERGSGMIVNIASVAALQGVPYLAAYGAGKAALAAFSQSLQAELAGTGIRLLVVYPGYLATDFFLHEKIVGGARRPTSGYGSPRPAAQAILRAIETDREELVLSREGKSLQIIKRHTPGVLNLIMRQIARRLRTSSKEQS